MEHWEHRFRFSDPRLADRFLHFGLNILLHLRLNTGEVGVLCFQEISPWHPIRREKEIRRNGKQGTVLVHNVKLVDSPERIISALVRFEPVDSFYRFREHSLYFSSLSGFVLGSTLRNRELHPPQLTRLHRPLRTGNAHPPSTHPFS